MSQLDGAAVHVAAVHVVALRTAKSSKAKVLQMARTDKAELLSEAPAEAQAAAEAKAAAKAEEALAATKAAARAQAAAGATFKTQTVAEAKGAAWLGGKAQAASEAKAAAKARAAAEAQANLKNLKQGANATAELAALNAQLRLVMLNVRLLSRKVVWDDVHFLWARSIAFQPWLTVHMFLVHHRSVAPRTGTPNSFYSMVDGIRNLHLHWVPWDDFITDLRRLLPVPNAVNSALEHALDDENPKSFNALARRIGILQPLYPQLLTVPELASFTHWAFVDCDIIIGKQLQAALANAAFVRKKDIVSLVRPKFQREQDQSAGLINGWFTMLKNTAMSYTWWRGSPGYDKKLFAYSEGRFTNKCCDKYNEDLFGKHVRGKLKLTLESDTRMRQFPGKKCCKFAFDRGDLQLADRNVLLVHSSSVMRNLRWSKSIIFPQNNPEELCEGALDHYEIDACKAGAVRFVSHTRCPQLQNSTRAAPD